MLVTNELEFDGRLACPACRGVLRRFDEAAPATWVCDTTDCRLRGAPFGHAGGKSVLVDFDRSILEREATLASGAASVVERASPGWRARMGRFTYGHNRIAPPIARDIVARLTRSGVEEGRRPLVLVVGGGSIGTGAADLYASDAVDVAAFDVYGSPHITFVADGHAIPMTDASVDAVWIQAVLEHVADPIDVVAEIARVLRSGGLVFADTPFLWPVHEKAYDFTRWTPSGHRWLFRDFEVLAAGASSGPGTACVLAIRYFAASLLRSSTAGDFVALPFFWFRLLDRVIDVRHAIEAPAGLFLYGRKAETPLDLPGLVRFYDEQSALEDATRRLA